MIPEFSASLALLSASEPRDWVTSLTVTGNQWSEQFPLAAYECSEERQPFGGPVCGTKGEYFALKWLYVFLYHSTLEIGCVFLYHSALWLINSPLFLDRVCFIHPSVMDIQGVSTLGLLGIKLTMKNILRSYPLKGNLKKQSIPKKTAN